MYSQSFISRRLKAWLPAVMCIILAMSVFCGCSVSYTLDDETADNYGVSSSSAGINTAAAQGEDVSENAAESVYISGENAVNENGEILPESSTEDTEYSFRNDNLLEQHFQKHNEDFGYATPQEYVDGANRVINNENSLHKLEAEDGDDVYYLEETNEFVIVSTDGYIRTYFKPSRGIDYYNSQ